MRSQGNLSEMKKHRILLNCLLAVFLLVIVISCDKDEPGLINTAVPDPTGTLTGHTECKDSYFSKTSATEAVGERCIEYQYDGEGTLNLRHVNALFNCCVEELTAQITIAGDTIAIKEDEVLENGMGCRCLCDYDIDYKISDFSPGQYVVKVGTSREFLEGEVPFIFNVDFSSLVSGSFCLETE